jgi:hypothetical protein
LAKALAALTIRKGKNKSSIKKTEASHCQGRAHHARRRAQDRDGGWPGEQSHGELKSIMYTTVELSTKNQKSPKSQKLIKINVSHKPDMTHMRSDFSL